MEHEMNSRRIRIEFSNELVHFGGTRYAALLYADDSRLVVDTTADVRDVAEAVWNIAHEMAREHHRLIPIVE